MDYAMIGRQALEAIEATRPVLTGIVPARDRIRFPGKTILHAGPAFKHGAVSKPILNSAMVAAVFEGWAPDFPAANAMLAAGEIRLAPAQDFNAVTPLAAVISPSMWVQEVRNAGDETSAAAYSALNGGSGAAARLGQCSEQALNHLRWINVELAQALRDAIREPIELIPIARHALIQGDDCHGRTQAGSERLRQILVDMSPSLVRNSSVIEFLDASPSFFLNLWMAACKTMVQAAIFPGSDVVTTIGANGVEVGLQLGGMPGRWWTAPAAPPVGRLEAGFTASDSLPAIGDSALVDAFGFGCMAMHYAPKQMEALSSFMPEESQKRGESILLGVHGGFGDLHLNVACSASRVVASNKTLPVALGILDVQGKGGRIGGGIALVPMVVLRDSFNALQKSAAAMGGATTSSA